MSAESVAEPTAVAGEQPGMWTRQGPYLLDMATFGQLLEDIAGEVRAAGFTPDAVLAVARGGLAAGGYLTCALDVPVMHTIRVRRTADDSRYAAKQRPVVDTAVPLGLGAGDKVLVVDDIVGTGRPPTRSWSSSPPPGSHGRTCGSPRSSAITAAAMCRNTARRSSTTGSSSPGRRPGSPPTTAVRSPPRRGFTGERRLPRQWADPGRGRRRGRAARLLRRRGPLHLRPPDQQPGRGGADPRRDRAGTRGPADGGVHGHRRAAGGPGAAPPLSAGGAAGRAGHDGGEAPPGDVPAARGTCPVAGALGPTPGRPPGVARHDGRPADPPAPPRRRGTVHHHAASG